MLWFLQVLASGLEAHSFELSWTRTGTELDQDQDWSYGGDETQVVGGERSEKASASR